MVYYCILIMLVLASLLEVVAFSRGVTIIHEEKLALVFSFIMIILAGGRFAIGNDYYSYQELFGEIHNDVIPIINDTFEVGYCLINKIFPSYRSLLFAVAFLAVFLKYKAFVNQQIGYVCVMLLFYYMSFFLYYDMGIIRQGIALAFCFLSLDMLMIRSKKFFVYIIIACCFHLTAIFLIPLWFVGSKEYPKEIYWIILGTSLLLGISNNFIQDFVGRIINIIGGAYINHKFNVNILYEESDLMISIIRRIVLSLIFIYQYKRKDLHIGRMVFKSRVKDKKIWLYINGFVLSTLVFSLFGSIGMSALAGRGTAALYSLYILIYEKIIFDKNNRILALPFFIVFMFLSYLSFDNVLYGSSSAYVPYQFFIN